MQDVFNVLVAIHALTGAALDRLELREFGFPEAQNIGRKTAKSGDFSDAEVKLFRDDDFGGSAGLGRRFDSRAHGRSGSDVCRVKEFALPTPRF